MRANLCVTQASRRASFRAVFRWHAFRWTLFAVARKDRIVDAVVLRWLPRPRFSSPHERAWRLSRSPSANSHWPADSVPAERASIRVWNPRGDQRV
jgi:hypothetical protein